MQQCAVYILYFTANLLSVATQVSRNLTMV
jgi:hypothetical protein